MKEEQENVEEKMEGLTWSIEVLPDKYKAIAVVEQNPSHISDETSTESKELIPKSYIKLGSSPASNEQLTEGRLKKGLSEKNIIYGIKPNIWLEFLTADGESEILLAEATMPVQPVHDEIIDYVGESIQQEENQKEAIDFFACKLRICQKDEILARKIPGKDGIDGMNVLGGTIPCERRKKLEFKLKKNVYLSEDGMEVKAACAGTPIRINQNTYLVENVHIVHNNVDLKTGNIDFPGDVLVGGNVNDGMRVHADGKIQVRGSVASAQLKAEQGIEVNNNIIASKITLGEKHVNRSSFCKVLQEVTEDLIPCISHVEQLQNVSKDTKVGHLLKVVLEKKYPQLAPKSEELEKMLNPPDPEFINPELNVAVRTLKHFLVGSGPLQLDDLGHIKNAIKIINHFITTKGNMLPASVVFETNYIQNSEITCAGDFICRKGLYNSSIKVGGSVKVFGVCRGGEISCAGDIFIWELGGPSISSTIIRIAKGSKLTVDFCHGNVKIFVGKELVTIDEYVQKLEVFREKGILQVERIKWDGHK